MAEIRRVPDPRLTGAPGPQAPAVSVTTTLPNGEVLAISVEQMSRAHDADELGRTHQRPAKDD